MLSEQCRLKKETPLIKTQDWRQFRVLLPLSFRSYLGRDAEGWESGDTQREDLSTFTQQWQCTM